MGNAVMVIGTELGWGSACDKYFKTTRFLVVVG